LNNRLTRADFHQAKTQFVGAEMGLQVVDAANAKCRRSS
jgi:hypothetical protein